MVTTGHPGEAATVTGRTQRGVRPALPLSSHGHWVSSANPCAPSPQPKPRSQGTGCCEARGGNSWGQSCCCWEVAALASSSVGPAASISCRDVAHPGWPDSENSKTLAWLTGPHGSGATLRFNLEDSRLIHSQRREWFIILRKMAMVKLDFQCILVF